MRHEGKRIVLEGAVTMDTVPALLPGALAAVRSGADALDFSATTTVDSAAIALALELRRASNGTLALCNLPTTALNLARLYSVADQLGIPD
jgi:ABC-type transporter Mla MlaB component